MGVLVVDERMKSLRAPRILHIATHGFFVASAEPGPDGDYLLQTDAAPAVPLGWLRGARDPLLRSGLALAGANTWLAAGQLPPQAEDGLLLARDIAGLDLLGTELVVLSAGDTGLGQVQLGEGVFGLRRAFAVAGARAVVMSLWKVPDLDTATLMDTFYEQLLDSTSAKAVGPGGRLWE